MTRIRLLVSDVDGTLVRSDKTLSDRVIAAVRRLQAAGVPVSIISARPPSGLFWIAERLGLTMPMGAFNGGTIIKPDGTILSEARVAPDLARQVLELIDRPGIVKWLFSAGHWHADRPDPVHDDRERRAANQQPIYTEDFTPLLGAVDKIVAVSDDHQRLAEIKDTVTGAIGDSATVIQSQAYYLDITALAANKGDGVAAIASAAGVPLTDIAVVGDERNDLPMFARAGFSVAMGQGPQQVRAAATRVAGSNDEDGVAQVIDLLLAMRNTP